MKQKYLIFNKKPFNLGKTVAQVKVTGFSKKEIDDKWNQLEKTFSKDSYQSCLTVCNHEMREFLTPEQ